MTGQYNRILAVDIQQVLVVAGDARLRPLIEVTLKGLLESSVRFFWMDPAKYNKLPALSSIDLMIVEPGEEPSQINKLLNNYTQGKLPPLIFIDYHASIHRAVNMMRLGALDYLDSQEVNEATLRASISLLHGKSLDSDQVDVSLPQHKLSEPIAQPSTDDATEINDQLTSGLIPEDDDATAVLPQLRAQGIQLTAEQSDNSGVTEIIPNLDIKTGKGDAPIIPSASQDTVKLSSKELYDLQKKFRNSLDDEEAPQLDNPPDSGKHKFNKGDSPFSGAWLKMPDKVVDAAWPFSAQDMAAGNATLGKYQVLGFLGVGGMASVFKARNSEDDQLYATKLLDPSIADDRVRDRFVQEFELLETIKHKHVVKMEEQVDAGKWIYTVMEYLPGGDLKSRIRRGIKREEAIRYTAQIAAGLHAAHQQHILHRDLKPPNILFRADGSLALVDFGVAKALDDKEKALTREGQMVGTPYYTSPEQATGAKVDRRCDLYALGIILFEMLEGKRPFIGKTSIEILMAHVRNPVPLLTQEWDALNDVINHLLAKSPTDRPESAQAVIELLNEACPGDVPEYLLT